MWQNIEWFLARTVNFLFRKQAHPCAGLSAAVINGPVPASICLTALIPDGPDRRLLAEISAQNGWGLSVADTYDGVADDLLRTNAQVVLCDRDLPRPQWKEAVKRLSSLNPSACIILLSTVVDAYLWTEVLRVGGYDVLSKPLRQEEVLRAVKLAISYWKSTNRPAGLRPITPSGNEALSDGIQDELRKRV